MIWDMQTAKGICMASVIDSINLDIIAEWVEAEEKRWGGARAFGRAIGLHHATLSKWKKRQTASLRPAQVQIILAYQQKYNGMSLEQSQDWMCGRSQSQSHDILEFMRHAPIDRVYLQALQIGMNRAFARLDHAETMQNSHQKDVMGHIGKLIQDAIRKQQFDPLTEEGFEEFWRCFTPSDNEMEAEAEKQYVREIVQGTVNWVDPDRISIGFLALALRTFTGNSAFTTEYLHSINHTCSATVH